MNFDVSPEQLRQHGGDIVDGGTSAVGELGALHGETTSDGAGAWGSDGAVVLAGLYSELTSLTGEALDLLTSVLRDGGTQLQQMADRYQQTEDEATSRFRQIQGGPA